MFEKPPFSKTDEQRITEAIRQAELNTSGEIRVHIERTCAGDPYQEAVSTFEKLGMTKTELRNGVLILVSLDDHKFAIIGDQGIDQKVPENFWQQTKDLMLGHFKQGNIVDGIIEGITDAGDQLKKYFPYQTNDQNELSDDISYGKDE